MNLLTFEETNLLTKHNTKLLCVREQLMFSDKGEVPILTIKNAECP